MARVPRFNSQLLVGDVVVRNNGRDLPLNEKLQFDPDLSEEECEDIILQSVRGDNSVDIIYSHMIKINKFKFDGSNMYCYNEKIGAYKFIKLTNEALAVNQYISRLIRGKIKTNTIKEVILRLKSEPENQIKSENFNPDEDLINTTGGVIKISDGEIELLPHNHSYMFNYVLDVQYLPEVKIEDSPTFLNFAQTSLQGDKDKSELLLEIIGICLSNYKKTKKAFFLIGEPNSGKSKILEWLIELLGKDNVSTQPLHRLGAEFSSSCLFNKKVNINTETRAKGLSNIDVFKALVGFDYVDAVFKFQTPFTFKNSAKLIFAGNSLPTVADEETTSAFYHRLVMLKFPVSIPQDKWDIEMSTKLRAESNVIFSLSIQALLKLRDNEFKFTTPNDSASFLEDYKQSSSHIDEFVACACEIGTDFKEHTRDLYDCYVLFTKDNAITDSYNADKFTKYLSAETGIQRTRFTKNGAYLRGFEGIRIKPATFMDEDNIDV